MEDKMKRRLNITIDEELYKKIKALAFFRDESISEIIRKSLRAWIDKKIGKKEELILSAKDEKEILEILSSDEFVSSEEAKEILEI
ncbi:MAG: ribbon-helix-helix protein, CopG family [Candidatus Aminicenantes bacterium]|nr:ribbon-helix-helix protein, CopG family [Candidatus Aminicenantes bacterium]NQT81198.1 ribbon-helix-helix protein, CopG family [Candidatus Aminicenantes bacterium]